MRPWGPTVSATARMRGRRMSILRHLETPLETAAGKQKYKQMVYLEPGPIPVVRQSNVRWQAAHSIFLQPSAFGLLLF